MVTKAFLSDTVREFYSDFVPDRNTPGNKAGTFTISIPWYMCTDTIPEVGPAESQGQFDIAFPVGSSPSTVYQMCYDRIVQAAIDVGFEPPAKADVFCSLPTSFDVILP